MESSEPKPEEVKKDILKDIEEVEKQKTEDSKESPSENSENKQSKSNSKLPPGPTLLPESALINKEKP